MADEARLIDPSGIPHFIGDLSTLDTDVMLLTADAAQFRASGSDVHTDFQGLSAFYKAPEAEQLFATTLPVRRKADAFAGDLEKVAAALSDYGVEVRPLVARLEALRADASAFVNSLAGDGHWRRDRDKVDHNNDLWHDVNHTVAAFHTAERATYDRIVALIGGTPLTADDGSHGRNMYGCTAEALDHAKETPWGAPVEREYEGWAWLAHQGKQVFDGVWQDGVLGTVDGVGTMVGWDGWQAAGDAWKNLAKVSTASALTSATMGAWWVVPDERLPSWLRDSRTAAKETVKGFVAYDQWRTNPARAAGAFGFNVLTVAGTEGVGGVARAGAAARTVSVVGKVGRAIDPMTYAAKAGTAAFTKVGDTFSTLKNLNAGAHLNFPERPALPEPSRIPHDAIPDVDAHGNTIYLTKNGDVLNASGSVRQHVDEAAHELSTNDHAALNTAAHGGHPHDLVGARAEHTGSTHTSEQTPGQPGRDAGGHATSGEGSSSRGSTGDVAHGHRARDAAGRQGSSHHRSEGTDSGGTRELTAAERKRIRDEHVSKANNDPAWREEHYDALNRRKDASKIVDGAELPVLAKDANGNLISKHDLPGGPSEIKYGRKFFPPESVDPTHRPDLDTAAKNRRVSVDLTNAERRFDESPSATTRESLHHAQHAYRHQLGDTPNNSKISERLGEKSAELHVVPEKFPSAEWVDLPKTPNGADMFDQLYKLPDGGYVIVEAKAPSGNLIWRRGAGSAQGMLVKQGTREYVQTIIAEMQSRAARSPKDGRIALDLLKAMKARKLQYVLVKAADHTDASYSGAVLEHFKIF